MKRKLIGDMDNGFLITRYLDYTVSIQEFVNGKHYAMMILTLDKVIVLKDFLNENL